jgi:hypothetical protein
MQMLFFFKRFLCIPAPGYINHSLILNCYALQLCIKFSAVFFLKPDFRGLPFRGVKYFIAVDVKAVLGVLFNVLTERLFNQPVSINA